MYCQKEPPQTQPQKEKEKEKELGDTSWAAASGRWFRSRSCALFSPPCLAVVKAARRCA
jgi:hypothetical protein